MTTVSDIEELISRVGIGDRVAFSELYSATSAKLFGVCLRVLNNRNEAEDALQEVYIKIWQKADRFAANGYSPMTWLITLARNLAIDKLRARKAPTQDIDDAFDLSDGKPTPEDEAVNASERKRIDVCLEELDKTKGEAIRSVYLNGDSYQEIAERFDVPINTVRTWLRRSLVKLKDCLSR